VKTDSLCHEVDVHCAMQQFNETPIHKTFSAALACLVIHASRQFLTNLQAIESTRTYWRHTSANVVFFEAAAYFWSMLSFDINETVRYEFEEDKNAVKSGMLDGFNNATAIMRNDWFGFSSETYALSRIFLYPKDPAKAAENFYRVLEASEGRDFPLFPGELVHKMSDEPLLVSGGLSLHTGKLYGDIKPELDKAAASLVSYYLENRLE
jgi:hypothetical protein